jgi:hypothetical protein
MGMRRRHYCAKARLLLQTPPSPRRLDVNDVPGLHGDKEICCRLQITRLTATQGLARRRAVRCDGHFVHFGKVGGTKARRSSDDLIAFVVGSDGNGLDESSVAKLLAFFSREQNPINPS